jgi:hypothetical protein
MHKLMKLLLPCFVILGLLGCGESYPKEALIYLNSAQEVLIENSVCNNVQDCRKRELLFWEGGNPYIPSLNMAFVNLYETNNPLLADAVEARLRQVKKDINGPPVKLSIFSSPHLRSKIIFRETIIR